MSRDSYTSIATSVVASALITGCSSEEILNPSFPLMMDEARMIWKEMQADPKPLDRPVVVLGGIADPGLAVDHVADKLAEIATEDSHFLDVPFLFDGSFDSCAKKLIKKVDKKFPSDDQSRTIEVDAIGYSMGGLVGRYAASNEYAAKTGRRLNLHTLFTVSSPHQGAKLAGIPTFDSRVIDMRSDSELLEILNNEPRNYELICYTRLGDNVVGEENSAPPGMTPWWLSEYRGFGHSAAWKDKRILVDIARRLRNEQPFTIEPPAPLPLEED